MAANLDVMYSLIAQVLPQEGRDYEIIYDESGASNTISMRPMSEIGAAWVPVAMKAVSAAVARMKAKSGKVE